MSLAKTRRLSAPMAAITIVSFVATLLPPKVAGAQTAPSTDVTPTAPISDGTGGPATLSTPAPGVENADSQTTVDLSTGAAKSSFSFQLPKARGDAQPLLAVNYNSSTGTAFAGVGWTINLPSITRKGPTAIPRFTDDVFTASQTALGDPNATFDEYLVDGQQLVPICIIGACSNALATEVLPQSIAGVSVAGWMYFRREVDDGARYFFSPTGQTWIKQEKSGQVTQFGHPLDSTPVDTALSDSIERPAPGLTLPVTAVASPVYRWNIVRQSDTSGNTVYYTWTNNASLEPSGSHIPGTSYLSDIYDTLAESHSPAPSAFAHHVHVTWQLTAAPPPGAGPVQLGSPVWRAPPFALVSTVDVTSASWSSLTRGLVRRYSLSYVSNAWNTNNRLTSISLEGECPGSGGVLSPVLEVNNLVPHPSGCANSAILQLAQYTYYPDAPPGFSNPGNMEGDPTAFSPLDTAFNLPTPLIMSDQGQQTISSSHQFVDVDGDGAADLLTGANAPTTGFNVQLLHGPPSLAAIPSQSLLPQITDSSCSSTSGTYIPSNIIGFPPSWAPGACINYHPLFLGDWLANGAVSWLTYDGPQLTTGPPPTGPWNVYSLSGGSFAVVGANAGVCQGAPGCDSGHAIDLDGDGLTDLSLVPAGTVSASALTQRSHGGGILPFSLVLSASDPMDSVNFTAIALAYPAEVPPAGCDPGNNPNSCLPAPSAFWRSMADMNGDGLPDLNAGFVLPAVAYGGKTFETHLFTWLNHGDGTFGGPGTYGESSQSTVELPISPGVQATAQFINGQVYRLPAGLYLPVPTPTQGPIYTDTALGGAMVQMADVNGDGLADIVRLDPDALSVCLRNGPTPSQASWQCVETLLPALTPVDKSFPCIFRPGAAPGSGIDPSRSILQIVDADGSGIPRILFSRYTDALWETRLDQTTGNVVSVQLATQCYDQSVYGTTLGTVTSPSLGAAATGTYPGLLQTVTLLGGACHRRSPWVPNSAESPEPGLRR